MEPGIVWTNGMFVHPGSSGPTEMIYFTMVLTIYLVDLFPLQIVLIIVETMGIVFLLLRLMMRNCGIVVL